MKKRNCAFGNAKKHGLISQFNLFNLFFSLELRLHFQKTYFDKTHGISLCCQTDPNCELQANSHTSGVLDIQISYQKNGWHFSSFLV
jgi:hypothetical protein